MQHCRPVTLLSHEVIFGPMRIRHIWVIFGATFGSQFVWYSRYVLMAFGQYYFDILGNILRDIWEIFSSRLVWYSANIFESISVIFRWYFDDILMIFRWYLNNILEIFCDIQPTFWRQFVSYFDGISEIFWGYLNYILEIFCRNFGEYLMIFLRYFDGIRENFGEIL